MVACNGKGKKMRKSERLRRAAAVLSADERRALADALRAAYALERGSADMVARLERVALAAERSGRRKASDRKTDGARRRLVGARIPIEDAERCANCARLEGVSLYRFVVRALWDACVEAETAAAQRLREFKGV